MGVRDGYQPGKSVAATTMPTSGVGSVRGGYKPRPEAQIPEPTSLERKVINSFNTLDSSSRNSSIKRLQDSAKRGDTGAQRKLLLLSNYANKNAASTPDFTDNSLSGKLYRAGQAVGQFGKEAFVDPVLRGGQALTELANTGKISNPKQFIADTINTGTNFVGGGVVKNVAGQGIKALTKQAIKQTAKTGATLGAIQGGATSFGRGEGVGDIAKNAAVGGALGGTVGMAVPVATGLARKGVSKLARGLEEAAAGVRPVNNATVANMGRTLAQDVKGAAQTISNTASEASSKRASNKPELLPFTMFKGGETIQSGDKSLTVLKRTQRISGEHYTTVKDNATGKTYQINQAVLDPKNNLTLEGNRVVADQPVAKPDAIPATSKLREGLPQATERPAHQAQIEAAVAKGDMGEVKRIIDAMPESDPYKASMASLFKDRLPQSAKNTGKTLDTAPKTIANDVPADVMNPGSKERGFVTSVKESPALSQETKDLADSSYDSISNKESLAKADARISTDEGAAKQWVLNAKKPSAEHTATAIRLIDKYDKAGDHQQAVDVIEHIAKKLTEAGQAVQAASILGRLSPEGVGVYAQRQINRLNDKRAEGLLGRFSKDVKLTPETSANLRELARRVQGLEGTAKIEAQQELEAALQSLVPASPGRKIATAQTIAQLLNPKTMIRNSVGNEMFYRIERLNKFVATPIDMARSTLTGKDRTVTFHTAGQGKYWSNFMKGANAGWRNVAPEGIGTQFDLGYGPAFTGKWNPMTYLEKTLGATLRGFDYAAYKRASGNTLGELATLQAMNKGLKGPARQAFIKDYLQNVPTNILDIADNYGKYVTFQDSNVLSRGLVGLKRGLNQTGPLTPDKEFGLGDLVLKYPKTPANLVMRGLDYSPAGVLRSVYLMAKPLLGRQGRVEDTTREATLALSRAITGSLGFTAFGYFLADKGVITGRASEDKDVKALQRTTGNGPYRVNLSALRRWANAGFDQKALTRQEGDYFASYDWAQPIAMAVSVGANASQAVKKKENLRPDQAIANSIGSAIQTVAEQPVLKGVTDFLGGGYTGLGDTLTRTAVSAPSSFVPTLSNQIRQLTDQKQRDAYTGSPLQQALAQVQNKIPGLSQNLPVRPDTLGSVVPTTQGTSAAEKIFNVFFNPANSQRYKLDPAAKLVVDLYDRTGQTTQVPRSVAKSVTIDGKKVNLTPQQYSTLQQYVGYQTRDAFTRLDRSPEFQALSDNDKVLVMQQVMTKIGQEAKGKMFDTAGLTAEQKLQKKQSSRARSSVVKSLGQ